MQDNEIIILVYNSCPFSFGAPAQYKISYALKITESCQRISTLKLDARLLKLLSFIILN